MPRNMRNFWIEADIDGRGAVLQGGPVSKDGGFDTSVLIRDNGSVTLALHISGRADRDGNLTLTVCPSPELAVTPHGNGFEITAKR